MAREDVIQPLEGVITESDVQGADGGVQLLLGAGTHNRCRHRGLVQQPGKSDVARRMAQFVSKVLVLADLVFMLAQVFVLARILRMICHGHALMVGALTLVLLVPSMMLSEYLQNFLGIYPA